ncbi:MAG TPA: hypothetical protein VFJ66_05940 [Gaiellales bacterium]|jgi:hypothetical protein|nr:hypothetical protein [Gaiellales bacterium]HEX2588309.1 hypothetical protein [Gaiellales bacterium]
MINILPIYQASKPSKPRRESEREYLIRMAQLRQLEERRANRRSVLRRIRDRAA